MCPSVATGHVGFDIEQNRLLVSDKRPAYHCRRRALVMFANLFAAWNSQADYLAEIDRRSRKAEDRIYWPPRQVRLAPGLLVEP